MSKINKCIVDGQVAVLYSPGFGAGWSTWADPEYQDDCIFDPWIVDILGDEQYDREEKIRLIETHCAVKYPDMYLGGLGDLTVAWVKEGTVFRIEEYDGSESVELRDQANWIVA